MCSTSPSPPIRWWPRIRVLSRRIECGLFETRRVAIHAVAFSRLRLTDKRGTFDVLQSVLWLVLALVACAVSKFREMVASHSQTLEVPSSPELRIEKLEEADDEDIQTYSNPAKYLFNVSKLTKNLYLSGACALRADTFEKLGITCVVNCTTREELPDPPLPDRVTTYLRIPVPDSTATDLYPYFHQTSDTVRKIALEGGSTLVHCVAGVSRSVSICLAYLMKHHDMSLKEAYKYVERRRPCIKPNNSFFKQLIDFEIENRAVPSISMILDNNTQSRIPDIYQCKFNDKLCCQLKKCQKRHCGMH